MARSQDEPTEEPTPQRLLKARQRGQVAVSREFSGGLGFAALVAVLVGSAPAGVARVLGIFRHALATAAAAGDSGGWMRHAVASSTDALEGFTSILLVPLGIALGAGILVGAIQTGGLLAWQAARPDFSRQSPATGLKRVFGPRIFAEIGKGLMKVTVVIAVALVSVGVGGGSGPRRLYSLAGARPDAVLAALGLFSQRLGTRVALALVLLGTLDLLLTRRRHRRSLMMTRDQVKREHKEMEGDPRHRAERQRLHRELNEQRMIDDVRKADFVVVNPEHIAVAVKYDRDAEGAPQVVAKGERLLAERIKQVAREAGVPIYRDVGLARALNELPEGEEIPEVLYEAVAELLRVLWEMEQDRPAGMAPGGGTPDGGQGAEAQSHSMSVAPRAPGAVGSLSVPSPPSTWKRV